MKVLHTLAKIGKILVAGMTWILIVSLVSDPSLGMFGVVSAFSYEGAPQFVSDSGSQNPLNQSMNQSPSSWHSPQPAWKRLDFSYLPPPQVGSSLVLNPINKLGLLFGGINANTGELNDLWVTDGHSWMQYHTPHSPEPRTDASMAYDEARQAAVLFGGSGGGRLLGDTWIFDGVDWIQRQPKTVPSPRNVASMAYDAERDLTVLLGGLTNTGEKYFEAVNEMWIWDGGTWRQQFPATLPPARLGANMVYDPTHKTVLLFGGGVGGGFLEDTWIWDGAVWVERYPQHHPTGRANFGMAYDQDRQQIILFGGQTSLYVDPTELGLGRTGLEAITHPPGASQRACLWRTTGVFTGTTGCGPLQRVPGENYR
jgi:hypothetical protein